MYNFKVIVVFILTLANVEKFEALMVLGGIGDCMGFKNGNWEFNDIEYILDNLEKLGGIDKLNLSLPEWRLSDDTILNIASAEGLLKIANSQNEMLTNLYNSYVERMSDMKGRAPGWSCNTNLIPGKPWNYMSLNLKAAGCGASMRSMAIGARFWKPEMLTNLIITSVEGSRMSHHNPTGYLGGLISALFTSYALQNINPFSWGVLFRDKILPLVKKHVGSEKLNRQCEENLKNFNYFEMHWNDYLKLREIDENKNTTYPFFPEPYGFEERESFYKSICYEGNSGGWSGHDSVIIAYDALLGALTFEVDEKITGEALQHKRYLELIRRAVLHSGDSDSTGAIALSWYGALFGFSGVTPSHYEHLEYVDILRSLGRELFTKANDTNDKMNIPFVLGIID